MPSSNNMHLKVLTCDISDMRKDLEYLIYIIDPSGENLPFGYILSSELRL